MATNIDQLFDQCRRLPAADRLRLVEELLAMDDGTLEPGAAAAWAAEVARRTQEIDAGTVEPVAWPEVREGMQRRSGDG